MGGTSTRKIDRVREPLDDEWFERTWH